MNMSKQFLERLAREVSGVARLLEEHIKDYGEILSHVFMGELTRYILSIHNTPGNPSDQNTLREILRLFEEGFAYGDDEVKELIGVSFLENLTGEEGREALRTLLGPTMSEALKRWD